MTRGADAYATERIAEGKATEARYLAEAEGLVAKYTKEAEGIESRAKALEERGEVHNRRGTRVRFRPDPEIFGPITEGDATKVEV